MITENERDLIVDLFEESAEIYCRGPIPWKDPHSYQDWARRQRLFVIEGGVHRTSADTTDAGRKQFSRLRLSLESSGLIRLTRLSMTSQSICLTMAGLKMAEKLTGTRAPADLRKAIKEMDRE